MSKKSAKKANQPLAAGEPANRPAAVAPLDQPARSEAVAAETPADKSSAPSTPAKTMPKLQTPLAAVWPAATLPEPIRPPQKAAGAEKAPTPTATPTVEVRFVYLDLRAKQVSLCGDFNGWASDATPMKRQNGGPWETSVALAPGRYQYKFLVDGQWLPDLLARENVYNEHGTLNSVVEVRA